MKLNYLVTLALIGAVALSSACITPGDEETPLRVIYAGSLIIPFEEMEKAFEAVHPDVDVLLEGHGSIQVIRHVTDLQEEYDVLAVADDSLIPDMMYPDYADWYVRFARNQVVIAYTNQSLYADELTDSNWYEILSRPEVKFGFSNPMFDACGYRTLIIMQLAEGYYGNETIFEELIARQFKSPFPVLEENGTYTIVAPEVFEPHGDKLAIRGGSVQLLALLELGGIDYAFEYRSVAEQHGLRYLELPAEIDLSSEALGSEYEQVIVRLGFQRFSSIGIDRPGRPVFYAITIPSNAPNRDRALEFVRFVLSEEGARVLQSTQHPSITPEADSLEHLPEELSAMVTKEIAA